MDEYEEFLIASSFEEEVIMKSYQEKSKILNRNLQDISDYLGPESSEMEKYLLVNFPSGYISKAEKYREKLRIVKNQNTASNIAYSLMMVDLYRWLLNRTDLKGTVREMIIKNSLHLVGSVCETLTVISAGKCKNFKVRIQKLLNMELITQHLSVELLWLWEIRNGIHLFELDEKEFGSYDYNDFTRSTKIIETLIQELNRTHE